MKMKIDFKRVDYKRVTVIGLIFIAALVAAYVRFGFSLMVLVSAVVAGILLAITVIDYDIQEIPDKLVITLIPCAVAMVWLQPQVTLLSRGIGFLAISLPMLLLALVINGAFGGGDIKLMTVCGFMLGWQSVLVAFFIAILLAGAWIVVLVVRKKAKRGQHIAFGPALCAGVFAALLYGGDLVAWYRGFLMI